MPHTRASLVAFSNINTTTGAILSSAIALLTPNSDGIWDIVDDPKYAYGWGPINPLPLPDPSSLGGGTGRRLNSNSLPFSKSMASWSRGYSDLGPAGRFGPCNLWALAVSADHRDYYYVNNRRLGAADSAARQLLNPQPEPPGFVMIWNGGAWTLLENVHVDYLIAAPRPPAPPTPSQTVVRKGATPPASATAAATIAPSRTPTLTSNAAPSPTRAPWNMTRFVTLASILVTRVGPFSARGAKLNLSTQSGVGMPVYIDEFAVAAFNKAPLSTKTMPRVRAETFGGDEAESGIDYFPTTSTMCTLPILPPGPCAEAHGQTALDGSALGFVCYRALENAPASVINGADRVLVMLSPRGALETVPIRDDAAGLRGGIGASLCSITPSLVDEGPVFDAQRWYAAGGGSTGGESVVAFNPQPDPPGRSPNEHFLTRGSQTAFTGGFTRRALQVAPSVPDLQHTLYATGFQVYSPWTPTLFASSTYALYWASQFDESGNVMYWSRFPVYSDYNTPSWRGFAVYSNIDTQAAQVWVCDTHQGIISWTTTWPNGAGPLMTDWTKVGTGSTPTPIARGGCQGMLVRDEGTTSVALSLYVTTSPPVAAAGTGRRLAVTPVYQNALYKVNPTTFAATLLATSPADSVFRGVFVPPGTPPTHSPSHTPRPSVSAARSVSRSATASKKPKLV